MCPDILHSRGKLCLVDRLVFGALVENRVGASAENKASALVGKPRDIF